MFDGCSNGKKSSIVRIPPACALKIRLGFKAGNCRLNSPTKLKQAFPNEEPVILFSENRLFVKTRSLNFLIFSPVEIMRKNING